MAVVTEYQGERVEWDFEVVGHLAGGPTYSFTPSLKGCQSWNVDGGTEMECLYTTASSPFYGDIYTVIAEYTPADGLAHHMWTKVRPYPNHDEYDFLGPITSYYTADPILQSFNSIFIPMWPEDVITAYEVIIRYYSTDRTGGTLGFNIRILFWGYDHTAVANLPWLKGTPGENPFLKFCGKTNKPRKTAGGPGL